MKNNETYIDLIISACKKIGDFTKGMDEQKFLDTDIAQSAVMMQLQVIGELAKKIEDNSKKEIDVPWKLITGLRDIISHDYFSLNVTDIWDVVANNIPELEKALLEYLHGRGLEYMPPFDDTTHLME
jgi:uncharacterized protein with HEPN domain